MLAGATRCASPTTSTTWNATETATQLSQLANAYASLALTTVSLLAQTRAKATSYAVPPSVVTIDMAWLSPGRGGSGRSNGKTQVGRSLPTSFGVRTRAGTGCAAVGNGEPAGQIVRAVRCSPSRNPAVCDDATTEPSVEVPTTSWSRPRSVG